MNKQDFLALSLPYGLKGEDTDRKIILNIIGFDVFGDVTNNLGKNPIRFISPVLHPLTDLIKPITHKGETFVPALALAELALSRENVDNAIKNSDSLGFNYRIVTKPFGKMLKVTRFDTWILLISLSEPDRCKYYIFKKLIEWHFDVAGLIEKGEAIDVNILEANPYA